MIRARWYFPTRRVYRAENLYQYLETEGTAIADENKTESETGNTPAKNRSAG
jgi:hypothetical protein